MGINGERRSARQTYEGRNALSIFPLGYGPGPDHPRASGDGVGVWSHCQEEGSDGMAAGPGAMGRVKEKVVPWWGVLSTQIRP